MALVPQLLQALDLQVWLMNLMWEQQVLAHVYFREPNAAVPQASYLSDILNDRFTNMANVLIEERQPFLLSIEKGFEWLVWMHRQEDTCLCLCSLEKQRVSCLLHLLFLWYRNEHGGCRHLRNQQAIPPRSG